MTDICSMALPTTPDGSASRPEGHPCRSGSPATTRAAATASVVEGGRGPDSSPALPGRGRARDDQRRHTPRDPEIGDSAPGLGRAVALGVAGRRCHPDGRVPGLLVSDCRRWPGRRLREAIAGFGQATLGGLPVVVYVVLIGSSLLRRRRRRFVTIAGLSVLATVGLGAFGCGPIACRCPRRALHLVWLVRGDSFPGLYLAGVLAMVAWIVRRTARYSCGSQWRGAAGRCHEPAVITDEPSASEDV